MVFEQLGVSSDIFSQGLQGGLFFVQIVGSGLGLAIILFIIYKLFLEYNITIFYAKGIGKDSVSWHTDKAKIINHKSDNSRVLQLMRCRDGKNRISCEVPNYQFRSKKGKSDHYMFYLTKDFSLVPMVTSIDREDPNIKAIALDQKAFFVKETVRRLIRANKEDAFSKYLPSLIVVLAFIITFFIAYFGFSYLGDGMGRLAGEFGNVAAQCAAF